MCGRYALHHSDQQIALRFAVDAVAETRPRYNIAPTQDAPVIRMHDGRRALEMLRWGLIPVWMKEQPASGAMINAKSETLAEKPTFRPLLARRRCIVPADGFYEWRQLEGRKQPVYIRPKDGEVLGLAGLWDTWRPPDGAEPVHSFTIITTAPNDVVKPIHDRMPAILLPEHEATWLDPDLRDYAMLQSMLRPYPSERLEAYPVTTMVNAVRNDDAECIEPLE